MNFAEKLNLFMTEKCITNYRLSRDIGVHASTVAAWKNGKAQPQIAHVKKIANYFGIEIKELID